MNVTAVQCLAFEWTCPKCGQRHLCERDDLGKTVQCSGCKTEVDMRAQVYDNGAVMAVS